MFKRFFVRAAGDRNYRKSNAKMSVDFYVSKKSRILTTQLLRSSRVDHRQRLSEKLLHELSLLAGIAAARVEISDKKQHHVKQSGRVVMRRYGYYRPSDRFIYITNRTAVRGQVLAPKTFLDTLLHEWMHHYDRERLKLNSIHTAGFYARLKDLKEKLVI